MATATAILNTKYKGKDGQYPIVIRLIDGAHQKLHPLKFRIKEKYWNEGQVDDTHPEAEIINSIIDEELMKAKRYFRDCRLQNIPIDLDLVFSEIKSHSFTEYLRHRSAQHKAAGQIEMQMKAARYAKEFVSCFGREVYFTELTQDNLRKYDAWLQSEIEGVKVKNIDNTRAKKFEFLGKYYNNAIEDGKAPAPNPFKKYKIKGTPVKKEKLTPEQFKAIEDLPLAPSPVKLARDMFLFSYYCKGIRFEIVLTMPSSGVKDGRVHFRTNKGGRFMSVQIHPKLAQIIEEYKNDSGYIFGRIKERDLDTPQRKRSRVGSENAMVNDNLKIVAALAGVTLALSFHHARHTLAFHLKQVSGNIGAIQDILGHSRSQITETYLKTLDDQYLDKELQKLYGK